MNSRSMSGNSGKCENQESAQADLVGLVRKIEGLEKPLGKGLYRGLLKTVARLWSPVRSGMLRSYENYWPIFKRRNDAYGDWRPQSAARVPRLWHVSWNP